MYHLAVKSQKMLEATKVGDTKIMIEILEHVSTSGCTTINKSLLGALGISKYLNGCRLIGSGLLK